MTTQGMLQFFFVGLMSLILAYSVWSSYDKEMIASPADWRRQFLPLVSGTLLPGVFVIVAALSFWQYPADRAMMSVVALCVQVFLHASIYDLLLMLLLPWLREHISARACGALWLLPNFLYISLQSFMERRPLWLIRLPAGLVPWLFWGWLAGAVLVLSWNTVGHLVLRGRLLRESRPVTDPAVLAVWEAEVAWLGIRRPKARLLVAPAVTTPMTVGLFARSMRVLLPERSYSEEELHFILRHELIHIYREDSWTKFFLLFCKAVCWFQPLTWVALHRSGEDLELSCDELVLLEAEEESRLTYARLLLRTAGETRGYTTCLSGDAAALRYRLKAVTQPTAKASGALAVGLAFFLLCMTSGYVGLSYPLGRGEEVVFSAGAMSDYQLKSVSESTGMDFATLRCRDGEALTDYLAGLELEYLAGSYREEGRELILVYDTPDGVEGLVLSDHELILSPLHGGEEQVSYYIPGGVDWAYLDGLVQADDT